MVRVNLTRQSYEAINESSPAVSITRQHAEVMGSADEANGERVNLTRMSYEMIFETPPKAAVTRQHAEVMAQADEANGERVDLTRMSYEVITALIKKVAVTRQHAEVMGSADEANGERVNLTRMSYEVLSRKGPSPVVPLDLADEVDLFMHNWSDRCTLESAWLTDVQQSAVNGAEERRALSLKPARAISAYWLVDGRSEVDRMLVRLRRMAQARFQMPLYMDQTRLTASSSSGTPTIFLDTTRARFFAGARVAIVRRSTGAVPFSVQYGQISTFTTSSITLTSNLTASVDSRYVVLPLIDCEILLNPSAQAVNAHTFVVKLVAQEVAGASQLPARGSDIPIGYPQFMGKPIFDIEPNWINGFEFGIDRQGEKYGAGRTSNTYTVGDRGRLVSSYFLALRRQEEAFSVVEFWETRRGRLRSFWLADQDQIWEATSITSNFIDIDPIGSFDQFVAETDYIAVVQKDGTVTMREVVTIQAVLGIWRVTVGTALPTIPLSSVQRIARARTVRFDADVLQETWDTSDIVTMRLGFIECLNEEDAEL